MPTEWLTTRPTEPGWYFLRWEDWSPEKTECCAISDSTNILLVDRLHWDTRELSSILFYRALWQKIDVPDDSRERSKMPKYRLTKPGVAICPFFTWTSENIGEPDKSSKENDVNLTHCVHPDNEDKLEGNCSERECPLVKAGQE